MENLLSIPEGLEVRRTLKVFLSSKNHQMPQFPKMLQYGNEAKLLSFLIKAKENASGLKNGMLHWEQEIHATCMCISHSLKTVLVC